VKPPMRQVTPLPKKCKRCGILRRSRKFTARARVYLPKRGWHWIGGDLCVPCDYDVAAERLEQAAARQRDRASQALGLGPEAKHLKIAPFLDQHVTYVHVDGRTWERVPMQLFEQVYTFDDGQTYRQPILRLGRNFYEFSTVNWGVGKQTRRGGSVHDRGYPDEKRIDRREFLQVEFGHRDDQWPKARPLLPKSDSRSKAERAEWLAEAKRERAAARAWRKRKRHWKRPTAAERRAWAKEARRRVGDRAIRPALARFIRRGGPRARALVVYRALSNMRWKRVRDGKLYGSTWRHAGALVAEIRDRNEHYLDYYCTGFEGRVGRTFAAHMQRAGWVPMPYGPPETP